MGLMWCSQPPPRSRSMWRTFRTRPLSSWAHPTMAMCTRTPFRWVAVPLHQRPLQMPPALTLVILGTPCWRWLGWPRSPSSHRGQLWTHPASGHELDLLLPTRP